jgi:hypothetical protein
MATRTPILALALLAATACASRAYTLRTEYRAALAVESSGPLACELPPRLEYGKVERVTEKGNGAFSGVEARERWTPLPLRIVNRTDEVITVDWERSVFVDASGLSRRVRVFPAPAGSAAAAAPSPLDRPPTAVVAPGTRAEVLVLPEPAPAAPVLSFLPPSAAEQTPLRLVLSAAGSSARTAECVVTATLESTRVERNADERWPGHGEACIPGLGCADGLSCQADVCVDPKAPPLPPGHRATPARKGLYGESCERDADCVQGFHCDSRMRVCGG